MSTGARLEQPRVRRPVLQDSPKYLTPFSSIRKQLKNKELSISGSHWPVFVYKNETYEAENPWKGLFRNELLVKASLNAFPGSRLWLTSRLQGYKHIFTSPSSVDEQPKATRSGNARIHGMTHVTPASLAYAFTQVSAFLPGCFTERSRHRNSPLGSIFVEFCGSLLQNGC